MGLIKVSGEEKVILIGHDWGGLVAWRVARSYPNLIRNLIVIDALHDSVMGKHIRQNPMQLLKSWYIIFFQVRWIPERLIRLFDWEILIKVLRSSS